MLTGTPSTVVDIKITTSLSVVVVTWHRPLNTGGYDYSQILYFVEYGIGSADNDGCQSCTSTPTNKNTTVSLVGLKSSSEYRIRVVTVNPAGISASNWTSVWTRGIAMF